MTSYLTSIDTISLSRTVFEIFDFKVCRVWPWPLTSKFESQYMTFYFTSKNTIFLSRTVLEIMPVKILKAEQNGGICLLKVKVEKRCFFYYRNGTSSHRTASFEIFRIKIGSAVWAVPVSKSVKSWKKRISTNPYMLGICTSVPENCFETRFC